MRTQFTGVKDFVLLCNSEILKLIELKCFEIEIIPFSAAV